MRHVVLSSLKLAALVALHFALFAVGSAVLVGEDMGTPEPSRFTGLALLVIGVLDVAVLAAMASRSRLRGWRLWLLLAGAFYFVKTFTSMIEAAYFMKGVTASMLPALFAMTLPLSILLPAAVALAFGPAAREEPGWRWPPMSAPELALKVAVLSVVVYPVLFFVFGYFVAWQSPAVREFYGASTDLGFFAHIARTFADDPKLFAFEALRGLMWVACALAIAATTRGSTWVVALLVALLFALVQNGVHLLPNPLMPTEVRWIHFWETATSNVLNAVAIVWLLSKSHARRSGRPLVVP